MANFRSMNIANGHYVYNDICAIDPYVNPIFISCVGLTTAIKKVEKEINRTNTLYINGLGSYRLKSNTFKIEKRKAQGDDFVHLIAYKKNVIEEIPETDNYRITAYIYYKNEDEKRQRIYDCLYENLSVPILEEWTNFITSQLDYYSYLRDCRIYVADSKNPLQVSMLQCTKDNIKTIVQNGLRNHNININGSTESSSIMEDINGLDEYLTVFSGTLAEKIQQSFVPKHIPGKNYCERLKIFDDNVYYNNNIELFDAQMDIIQANINHLKDNDKALVIGECGSGKTIMANAITYSASEQDGYCTFIMSPSHLTQKWKREIDNEVPNSRSYILHDIDELIELDEEIKDKDRDYNLYLIMSKENAKLGFGTRPAAVWSNFRKGFVCPDCGTILTKSIWVGAGRDKEKIEEKLSITDFLQENQFNHKCTNKIKVWDVEKRVYDVKECGCKLWTPVNAHEESAWIKLGAEGWIMERHMDELISYYSSMRKIPRKEGSIFAKLLEKKAEIDGGTYKISAPRKFSLSKYIASYYKGYIDYLILDEIHMLKGESLQGHAMMDLINASGKVIGLTGTLLNGYADGIFYILYRMMSGKMRRDEFEYKDCNEFTRQFGVIKKTDTVSFSNNTLGTRLNTKEKKLPGVSPIVFTKYLLDTASFISLSDMSEGLPPYTEIPIGIDMDEELYPIYKNLEQGLKRVSSINGAGGGKTLGALLQTLSVFPDQPFGQPPVTHPDTQEVLLTPPELPDIYRNKERELLRIVQEKKALGEKVLVYYQWTGRTELDVKLTRMFSENNINSIVLESSVKTEDREEWIEDHIDDTIDVMICNPQLVETGLDLLQFPTIVFYQIGYSIFTMRQASRRSWRLSQTKDIEVYFLYYKDTIQEQALALMATKLQASRAIEGKMSEEGLAAMSNNEDLLTQIAQSVVKGIKQQVMAEQFAKVNTDPSQIKTRILRHTYMPFKYLENNNKDNKNNKDLDYSVFKKLNHNNLSVANLL